MKNLLIFLSVAAMFSQCRNNVENPVYDFPGKPEVPYTIKQEHEHLLNEIFKASLFDDSTGATAKKLSVLMQHHFSEEEDFVLPQLGLLPLLASGKLPEESVSIIKLSETLKMNLEHLSAEHQLIKAYMNELAAFAIREHHNEIPEFEKKLSKHAQTEEDILFPTAIMIGEYLKIKSEAM